MFAIFLLELGMDFICNKYLQIGSLLDASGGKSWNY